MKSGGVLALAALPALVLAGLSVRFAIARNGPAMLSLADRLSAGTRGARKLERASFGPARAQELVVWGPHEARPEGARRPALVFVHGGSWRSGSPRDYDFIGRAFAREGFLVVLAGYRLVPEGRYPAMLEDCAAALAWTHRNAARLGGDPGRIVIMGHSAGAYNAVMTALEARWLARESVPEASLAGVIGLSGPYDFLPLKSDATIAAFAQASDLAATQPIAHARADAPPILLVHGQRDDLVGVHNSARLARALEAAGAQAELFIHPAMQHNDPLIALAAPWLTRRDLMGRIIAFTGRLGLSETSGDTVSVPVQANSR